MAELSESQLLLLDNLMYYSGSAGTGKTVEEITTEMLVVAKRVNNGDRGFPAATFSGGFEDHPDEALAIAEAILSDNSLKGLRATGSIDTSGVRATCFVDASGEATIAVRGTGGYYDAWTDDFYGAYESDTAVQKEFAEWVNKQGEKYNNITITGHSKGGNLAQYATVVCGDDIDRCVSFDGQGFGKDFHEKYAEQILENRGKIKSISADDDFVNVLLDPIVEDENNIYLDVNVEEFKNNHSSFELWNQNKNLTENGNFTHTVEQGTVGKVADWFFDKAVEIGYSMPPYAEKIIVNWLGSVIALYMSSETLTHDNYKSFGINTLILYFYEYYLSHKALLPIWLQYLIERELEKLADLSEKYSHDGVIKGDCKSNYSALYNVKIKFDTVTVKNISHSFSLINSEIVKELAIIQSIKLDGTIGVQFNHSIRNCEKEIKKLSGKSKALHNTLKEIVTIYNNTERTVVNLV